MVERSSEPSTMSPADAIAGEERYLVVSRDRVTPTIAELWLRPLGDRLEYLPGEYVLLEDDDSVPAPRSYSIANAPRLDGAISLLVTRVPGGAVSTWVHERLRPGAAVRLTGPLRGIHR